VEDRDRDFRLMFEAIPDMLWSAGTQGVTCVNGRWTEFTGLADEEALGWKWLSVLHPDDRDPAREACARAVAGDRYEIEHRLRRHDGHWRWHLSRAVRSQGGSGRTWFGTTTDIHAHKLAAEAGGARPAPSSDEERVEAALRESEAKFRTAFHMSASVMVISSVEDGRWVEVNETFERVMGYPREEMLGRTSLEVGIWQDAGKRQELVAELLAKGHIDDIEVVLRSKSGALKTVVFSARLITLQDKPYALSTWLDITDRKRAEEELRHAHALIEGITKGSEDLIAAEDRDFRYIFFNEAYRREFRKLWGRDIQLGTSMAEALAPWPAEQRHACRLWRRALEGESFSVTTEFGPAEDARQVYDLRFNPLRDAQGQFVGAAHILRNVTEPVRMQEAMREQAGRLALLAESAHALLSTDDPLAFLDRIYAGLAGLLGLDLYIHYSTSPDAAYLDLAASHGLTHAQSRAIARLEYNVAVCGTVAVTWEPMIVEDVQNSRDPRHALIREMGVTRYICHPLVARGALVGTLSFGAHSGTHFDAASVSLIRTVCDQVATAIERARGDQAVRQSRDELEQRVAERTLELERQNERLRRLANQLTQAEQRERRRLAESLHDGLQQIIVAAQMQLPSCVGDGGAEAVQSLRGLLEEAIKGSRSLVYELSPPALHNSHLPRALEWLARWFATNHRFEVALHVDEPFPPLDEETKIFLFSVIRELLFNAVKHSGRQRAEVALSIDEAGKVCVTVADTGNGLNPAVLDSAEDATGLGLFGIRERIAALGGSLQIDSAPGAGAKFTLCIPAGDEIHHHGVLKRSARF
jgi:PAS domain S-box-containing protein